MLAPFTSTGTVDVRRYIYDKMKSYVNLMSYIGGENKIKCRESGSIADMKEPFISYTETSDVTNSYGVRRVGYQISAWGRSIEEMSQVKDLIIEIFNRNYDDNVKSLLVSSGPDLGNPEGQIFQKPLIFSFVVKDQKF